MNFQFLKRSTSRMFAGCFRCVSWSIWVFWDLYRGGFAIGNRAKELFEPESRDFSVPAALGGPSPPSGWPDGHSILVGGVTPPILRMIGGAPPSTSDRGGAHRGGAPGRRRRSETKSGVCPLPPKATRCQIGYNAGGKRDPFTFTKPINLKENVQQQF